MNACCVTQTTHNRASQVLSWLSFGDTTIKTKIASQARILGFFYVTTFAILSANKPKFQKLEPVQIEEVSADDKGSTAPQ